MRGWPADAGEIDEPLASDLELPSAGQQRLAATTRWQVVQRLLLPISTDGAHAERLSLPHPATSQTLVLHAPPGPEWAVLQSWAGR